MAASAPARVSDRRAQPRINGDSKLLLAVILNVIAMAFTYGKLVERVESIHEQLVQVRQDINQLRGGK